MNKLLISIKTKYADKIFNGTKIYEFRRKSIGEKNINKKIYVYSSEKDRSIIGYITFDKILKGNLEYILDVTDYKNDNDIKEYFKDCNECYALHISKTHKFSEPIKLETIRKIDSNFVIPQFYRYLKKDEPIYKELEKKCVKLDTIKNYLNTEKFDAIVDEIYILSKHLNEVYPDYKNWFYERQVKGCLIENRNIIFIKNDNDEIVGFSSLKKEKDEKKICTLYVKDSYREIGIGEILLEESFKYIETDKPLVTFSEDNYSLYEKIIKKYDWNLTQKLKDKYKIGKEEYCFNGYLNKN